MSRQERLISTRVRLHAQSEQATVTFQRGAVAVDGLAALPCKVTSDLDTLVDSDLQIEAVVTMRTAVLPDDGTRPNATMRAVVTDGQGRALTYNVLRWVPNDGSVGGIERGELKRP